ncbi:hsp90 co-chaperone Cdc37, partial [Cladochytrium tenue]
MGGFSYAKWDKLELSDDDDFECHPNVDKASMIRWKQAEIHRQRRERQDKITALTMEAAMNSRIIDALDKIRPGPPADVSGAVRAACADMTEWDKTLAHDVMVMAHTDRDPRWEPPVPDPFFMKRVNVESITKTLTPLADALAADETAEGTAVSAAEAAVKLGVVLADL